MSTTTSDTVTFERDQGVDKPTKHTGQLLFHHTSDTVTWQVDGKDRFVMGADEFWALIKADRQVTG